MLATAAAAAVVAAGARASTTLPSTTWLDKAGGYEITLPTEWKLVPRSKAGIEEVIAGLKKTKSAENTALEETYTSILDSSSGTKALSAYRFQAFAWPPDPDTPLLTEVSVGVIGDSATFGHSNLTTLGDEYASALAENTGSTIEAPRRVKLPEGTAEFVEGRIPAGSGLTNGVELYLIPHGLHVYELSFTADASLLPKATIFTEIAQDFRFA